MRRTRERDTLSHFGRFPVALAVTNRAAARPEGIPCSHTMIRARPRSTTRTLDFEI